MICLILFQYLDENCKMEPSTSSGRKRSTNTENNSRYSKTRKSIIPGSCNYKSAISAWLNCEEPSGSEAEDSGDTLIPEQHEHEEDTQQASEIEEESEQDSENDVPLSSLHDFYRMLDISSVNSHILYDIHKDKNTERGIFIKELARSLVLPHMKRRALNKKLPRELRMSLTRILGPDMHTSDLPALPELEEEGLKLRRRCHTYPLKLQRKSAHTCYFCKKHVCLQCAEKVCPDCV